MPIPAAATGRCSSTSRHLDPATIARGVRVARGRRLRARELSPRAARWSRRARRRRRVLHAVQQAGDAARRRRRTTTRSASPRACSARPAPRPSSTSSKACGTRASRRTCRWRRCRRCSPSTRSCRRSTLTHRALRAAGFAPPRIAVAALNPHAGDGGNFGREEIDVIAPAVKAGAGGGHPRAKGRFPADTVFVRARRGDYDAVLTMYHDQGQIAMKLMGFDRGVTLLGGFPFPICTPAHGTAYDIAGRGDREHRRDAGGGAARGADGAAGGRPVLTAPLGARYSRAVLSSQAWRCPPGCAHAAGQPAFAATRFSTHSRQFVRSAWRHRHTARSLGITLGFSRSCSDASTSSRAATQPMKIW